jgi:alkanesulfonate monooxygenase SsuD/methylene tetrahydromethanopterin reductase-like flavin-dependent oxidoreductase (luciferase family)
VPVWILGSSLFGAHVAAAFGRPFAFASHFAPRSSATRSRLPRAGSAVRAPRRAARDGRRERRRRRHRREARRLVTSLQQAFVNLRRGRPGPLRRRPTVFAEALAPLDRLGLDEMLACSVVGGPDAVARGLAALAERTGADDLMVTSHVYDHRARLRSFELAAGALALTTTPAQR